MNIKEKALWFAVKAHKNQVRKNEPEKPMIIHPISVGQILESYGCDDNVVAAGYLHDVVEDTKYTLEDIKEFFGEDIASLVDVASEPDKSLSWEERKRHTIETVRNLPLRKKLVICADKINNIEDLNLAFERSGVRDFSRFKRGEESQKWYYENIYKSLVFNEDENLPIFKRLKKAVDSVFSPKPDIFLDEIFASDQDYYRELRKLHSLKKELYHLKSLGCLELPFVIEFSGTPRTGKTTVINNLADFFKKGNFNVSLISELTTSEYYKKEFFKTIEDMPRYELNLAIFKEAKRQLEEAIKGDSDIIIIDRSLCDRLIWMYRLISKKTIEISTFERFVRENIGDIQNMIDMLIVTYTDSLTALKRDYLNSLALENRRFLNVSNIEEYNESLMACSDIFRTSLDYYELDTTDISTRDSSVLVALEVMDKMKKKGLANFKQKYSK